MAEGAPQQSVSQPRLAAQYGPWLEGLGKLFDRVAVFEIRDTRAVLAAVRGLPPSRHATEVSLLEATPLRWAVEAGSPVVLSGRAPGVEALVRALALPTTPKALAVLPLVRDGRLAALAYGDRRAEALPLDGVAELFALTSRILGGAPTPKPPRRAFRSTARRPGNRRRRPLCLVSAPPRLAPSEVDTTDAALATLEAQEPPARAPAPAEPPWTEVVTLLDAAAAPAAPTAEVDPASIAARVAAEELADESWSEPPRLPERLPPTFAAPVLFEAPPPAAPPAPRPPLTSVPPPAPVAPLAPWQNPLSPVDPIGAPAPSSAAAETAEAAPSAPWIVTPAGLLRERGVRRPRAALRALLSLAVLLAASSAFLGAAALAPPRADGQFDVAVQIPARASPVAIATILEERGIVRNRTVFRWLARLSGADRQLRAGDYRLSRGVWAWRVLEELERGQVSSTTVTIPEGVSLREVAQILGGATSFSPEAYLAAARDPRILARFAIPASSLEGYLFPETYTFARDLRPGDVLSLMVEEMVRRLAALPGTSDATPQIRHERLTLASIVEREARYPGEQARIAGVFQNRLDRFMRLESCATIQYALGQSKERLLLSDLQIDSPYNTYLRQGLPPGPIASPGAGALAAAFVPERHDYLFFVAREDGTGRHVFTKTFAEHQKVQRRIKAWVASR